MDWQQKQRRQQPQERQPQHRPTGSEDADQRERNIAAWTWIFNGDAHRGRVFEDWLSIICDKLRAEQRAEWRAEWRDFVDGFADQLAESVGFVVGEVARRTKQELRAEIKAMRQEI